MPTWWQAASWYIWSQVGGLRRKRLDPTVRDQLVWAARQATGDASQGAFRTGVDPHTYALLSVHGFAPRYRWWTIIRSEPGDFHRAARDLADAAPGACTILPCTVWILRDRHLMRCSAIFSVQRTPRGVRLTDPGPGNTGHPEIVPPTRVWCRNPEALDLSAQVGRIWTGALVFEPDDG